ncbi:hypothetical protein M8J77_020455 [Diaphorina citri]|nr:hypothetical protein M8J77_020455 [Diaphorina citri]
MYLFADDWKSNPEFKSYLQKLGSNGVEHLNKEVDHLADEKATVLNQTRELAFSNYKTFIRTAECAREISSKFESTEHQISSLLTKLPDFVSECEEFNQVSSGIRTRRRLNTLTLTLNAQLLQLLELPQLMDSCIRAGLYEDALRLATYVKKLERRHSDIPIILSIVEDVEKSWVCLMYQLLSHLRTDLQLPKCLKVVGYLRRMQLFSEPELRLKFLQARDSFFQSVLQAIPTQDANEHLSKVIELSRTHLFNIVSQYRAVFSDDEGSENDVVFEGTHFFSWINEKVLDFLATVEKDLPLCPFSSLDPLLEQSLYFGLSLSRVGCDFRGLVAPLFIRTINQRVEGAIEKANIKLEKDMEKFTLPSVTTDASKTKIGDMQEQPPSELLDYYIFADYCNQLLAIFNDLRLCAPLSLVESITCRLQQSLCSTTQLISLFQRQEQQALSPNEKESLTRLCVVFATKFVPHIQRCLHVLFKPDEVGSYFGMDRNQLEKEGLGYLNQSAIIEPISQLLPAGSKSIHS